MIFVFQNRQKTGLFMFSITGSKLCHKQECQNPLRCLKRTYPKYPLLQILIWLSLLFLVNLSRSSRPEVFCKKDALRNFTRFTGKHLCQGLFFNKVAYPRLAQVFFCEFCEISKSKNTFFHRTSLVAASVYPISWNWFI